MSNTPPGSSSSVKVFYPELDTQEVVRRIRERLPLLEERLPLTTVVLFGSYAKGSYTVASDVDLLVIYRGRPRGDAFQLVKRSLGIPRLEPHVYAKEEYLALKDILEAMAREGIVLFRQVAPPGSHRL